jgi:hypothetical protein
MAEDGELPTQPIAYAADLVLIVGTPATVKLSVSSIVLKDSSKVFAALLGPNFAEGQPAATSGLKEVTLADDDPSAMSDMCFLLHGRPLDKLMKAMGITDICKQIDGWDPCDVFGLY